MSRFQRGGFAGDLMGISTAAGGRISGMDTAGGTRTLRALVPMSEMLSYLSD